MLNFKTKQKIAYFWINFEKKKSERNYLFILFIYLFIFTLHYYVVEFLIFQIIIKTKNKHSSLSNIIFNSLFLFCCCSYFCFFFGYTAVLVEWINVSWRHWWRRINFFVNSYSILHHNNDQSNKVSHVSF